MYCYVQIKLILLYNIQAQSKLRTTSFPIELWVCES